MSCRIVDIYAIAENTTPAQSESVDKLCPVYVNGVYSRLPELWILRL